MPLLLEQLRGYDGGAGERAVVDRFLALLESAANPFSRENLEHVTGSTVIADASGRQVLLRYHRKLERWLQPGGHVEDEDASVFDTALREAREETGMRDFRAPHGPRILDVDVHDIPARNLQPPHRHFDVRYLLVAPPSGRSSLFHRTRWVPLESVLGPETEESLARAVRKARERLAATA